jgi:23S rRNA pseudouridine1911/1915/1917 synthase
MLDLHNAVRQGEWLEVPLLDSAYEEQPLRAGSHPHEVRQWLLARAVLPAKWVNRLFSVGGIRWQQDRLQLRVFPNVPLTGHPLAAARGLRAAVVPGILYEDDFCLVLDKPAGMPVHPSRPGHQGTLDEAAVLHCLETGQEVPVRHIHRLDDDTSGPVLYAKNDLAQWKLDEDMRAKAIDRRYIALVHGNPQPGMGTIDRPIGADRHRTGRRRVTPSGDAAVTHYTVAERFEVASLVRITLETGRTHQIRVHFSDIGHPLIGDRLYGGDDSRLSHQALHGEMLVFAHPWSGRELTVSSPVPEWFREVRERLAQV